MIEKAILADPKNPLPLYQKANILLSLERYDEALMNLDQLKECAPQETSVYALMGKIYKKLNMHEKAMFYFGLALDLKPPATDVAIIKVCIPALVLFLRYRVPKTIFRTMISTNITFRQSDFILLLEIQTVSVLFYEQASTYFCDC